MNFKEKVGYLFTTNRGSIGMIILFELAIVGFLSTFSQPVVEIFGKPIIPIDLANSDRDRVARIIMLYHALGVPFLAAVTYFVLEFFEVRENVKSQIRGTVTIGALTTGLFGISFAYVLTDWVSHGLFIAGLTISFYAGALLSYGVWPTRTFPSDSEFRGSKLKNINLEYLNLTLTIFAILTSAAIGAYAAAHFGNGFDAALAEDIVRREHNIYERSVVSHLHIMVALLAAAVMLILLRISGMKGKLFHISQLLYTPGVIIMAIGAWLVVPDFEKAHVIINVGAGFLLLVGGILAVYGMIETSKKMLGDSYNDSSFGQKMKGLFRDPVNLTLYFQLIWVNVVSTFPGVYVAINLETYRSDAYEELERTFNTGHWHVLVTLIAIMVLLMSVNLFGVKGKVRTYIGWFSFFGTIIGFGFTTLYMLRDPATDGFTLFLLIDVGVMLMFLAVTILGIYYLYKWATNIDEIK